MSGAEQAVTLHREINALGGVPSDEWSKGYNEAIGDVLDVLQKRGFSEHADERPWQPWERNFSGGRVGVQEQQGTNENWVILHVESGGVKTTTSLRLHEAWMLAQMVSPQLEAERQRVFAEYRAARDALWSLNNSEAVTDELRRIAEKRDYGSNCKHAPLSGGYCTQFDNESGCGFIEADNIRNLANAIDLGRRSALADEPLTIGEGT